MVNKVVWAYLQKRSVCTDGDITGVTGSAYRRAEFTRGWFFQLFFNFFELILRSGKIGRVVGRLGFTVGVSASYSYSSFW